MQEKFESYTLLTQGQAQIQMFLSLVSRRDCPEVDPLTNGLWQTHCHFFCLDVLNVQSQLSCNSFSDIFTAEIYYIMTKFDYVKHESRLAAYGRVVLQRLILLRFV